MHKPIKTTINLFVDKLDKSGIGISLMQNEDVYFIPYALPGEKVKVNIINKFKSKVYCSNLEILKNSSERSKNTCKHFTKCGGCLLQHWEYENYKKWKFNSIRNPLLKLTTDVKILDMISAENFSRRRAKFFLKQEDNNCIIGFKKYRSETLININNCIIIDPEIMGFMTELKNYFSTNYLTNEILVFHVNKLDYGLDILIQIKKSLKVDYLINIFKNFKSKIASIYLQQNNLNPELILFYNKNKLNFGNYNVYGLIPPAGFYQATKVAENELIKNILNEIEIKNDYILDLYSGSGTFTLPLLKKGYKVYAIDNNKSSIESLIKSSKEQNLFNNIEYNISNLNKEKIETQFFQKFDVVILDPPRAGSLLQLTSIVETKVKKIIYISCNAQSFLRDTQILLSNGYKIKYVLPIDQFLYTSHLEIFSVFETFISLLFRFAMVQTHVCLMIEFHF